MTLERELCPLTIEIERFGTDKISEKYRIISVFAAPSTGFAESRIPISGDSSSPRSVIDVCAAFGFTRTETCTEDPIEITAGMSGEPVFDSASHSLLTPTRVA
eukprot:24051_1